MKYEIFLLSEENLSTKVNKIYGIADVKIVAGIMSTQVHQFLEYIGNIRHEIIALILHQNKEEFSVKQGTQKKRQNKMQKFREQLQRPNPSTGSSLAPAVLSSVFCPAIIPYNIYSLSFTFPRVLECGNYVATAMYQKWLMLVAHHESR